MTRRRWRADRCQQEAAALAYKTALGLVPFAAVAFILLKSIGKLDERNAFIDFFATNLFPSQDAQADVSEAVLKFADNISSGTLGTTGIIVLIVVVFLLYYDIEAFWNRIWSSPRPRSLLSKFFVFYTLATLVPFLLAISLYHTARFWRGGIVSYFAPLASTFGALLLANRLLPSVRVRWPFAAFGAAVSALLLELAKWGFARYVAVVIGRYRSIYGALGLVPLFLLWIYVGWLLVLLGAELAHSTQRLRSLEAGDRRHAAPDELWEIVNGATAARVLLEIARVHTIGAKPPTVTDLAEQLALPEQAMLRVLNRLRDRNLVVETGSDIVGWLPARPPTHIRLEEVLAAFRFGDPESARDGLGKLLGELDAVEHEKAQVTLAELLSPDRRVAE